MPGPDITFLHGIRYPECAATVDKRFDGYFTLQFMARGGVELFYDERRVPMEGRWFWTAFPGPRIRFHALPPHATWDHRYIAFKGPVVQRWHAQGLFFEGAQSAPDGGFSWLGSNVEQIFDRLLEHTRQPGSWNAHKAAHLLEGLLVTLAEARAGKPKQDAWLEKVLGLLAASRKTEPDYQAIAHTLGMSLSTLRLRFREAAGLPVHAYVIQVRILKARRQLSDTDLPIKQIAEDLGFRDIYYFTRAFKQYAGVPPAQFRRSRQG